MKKIIFMCLFFVILYGCNNGGNIDLRSNEDGAQLKFNLKLNKEMIDKKDYYLPSFSIWIENGENNKTLYVTKKAGKENWGHETDRANVLPVWFKYKEEVKSEIDSISGATPDSDNIEIKQNIPIDFIGKKINIFIESNISYDYNDFYKKDLDKDDRNYSDVNGQPSAVWSLDIETGDEIKENLQPVLIGHGQVMGLDSNIDSDLSNMTTGKEIFNEVLITYTPGKN